MNNLVLKTIKVGGKEIVVTDSREIALKINMRHDDLLKKIRGYKAILDEAFEDSEKLPSQTFFVEDTYINSQNKEQPCYQLTKQGCEMVANKMTGKKGVLFTATYVKAFNDMQEKLKSQRIKPTSSLELLELQVKSLKEVKGEVQEVRNDFEEFKGDLPLIGDEPEELQAVVRAVGTKALGGYGCPAYKDRSLSGRVFKSVWKYVKDQFNVRRYKSIKRKNLAKAIELAQTYKAPFHLQEEIDVANSQMKFEEMN